MSESARTSLKNDHKDDLVTDGVDIVVPEGQEKPEP